MSKDSCQYKDVEFEIEVVTGKKGGPCCAGHVKGQKFRCSIHKTPANFCPWALASLLPCMSCLAYGGEFPWEKKKGVARACCSDPDPVTFEVRRL